MAEKISLPTAYDPAEFETKWYRWWLEKGFFKAHVRPGKKRFSIVIPPPNVTGALHMGHALDTTLQDVFVRYRRMQGYETLWLPGTDHASIATHAKIEEMLAEEGTSRWELGREKFLERAWAWKEKYGHIITDQLKRLGASCDWSRERFTMDEGCSRAVTEVFVRLYEKGLIYRGKYMVNFCPGCRTVISDIEVEHQEIEGNLWYLRYPLEGGGEIQVATTRPETMLGDTAVAVNPSDERYRHLIGRFAVLPLVGRRLPIIGDDAVKPDFGTGAVKVTPSHDPDDFEMARRHNLDFVTVIDTDGKMTEEALKYRGLDRYEARKAVLRDLEAGGYLVKVEPYRFAQGRCHRCDTPVEPLISEQWFVKMEPLKGPAIKVVKDGIVRFVPERFTKVYLNWMENVRDWCISRQLWWGHRIPAWYCQNCGKVVVAREAPSGCPECGGPVRQDEDVLDTWFSSALWPFSTLGWPEKTADLEYFFPTDILVTGYDIIFFWVARMIFSSLEFTGREPFRDVLIHGLVRDAQGRKMSKSLGNGIDPLEVVEKYGADALRISLTSGVTMGNDMRFYWEKVEGSRNFCNKLWNAARFILMNIAGWSPPAKPVSPRTLEGRWILSRLSRTIDRVIDAMERFEPGEAIDIITTFVWDEFCDWYIEIAKASLKDPEASEETRYILWKTLETSLRLLHPFIPFITEEIWQALPRPADAAADMGARESGEIRTVPESIMVAPYPEKGEFPQDEGAEASISMVIEATRAIRNLRAEVSVPTGKEVRVVLVGDAATWEPLLPYIKRLAWANPLELGKERPRQALAAVISGAEVYLPLAGIVDLEKEISRLNKQVKSISSEIERSRTKLSDQAFLEKAPAEVVEKERAKLEDLQGKLARLEERLRALGAAMPASDGGQNGQDSGPGGRPRTR
ncbi:MAG: valine--tRNA ligase [Firmicutes bacterium]|nr:valine--tRNA ligase [Candidatus Fermentithermobacillaceae bacterium]